MTNRKGTTMRVALNIAALARRGLDRLSRRSWRAAELLAAAGFNADR